MYVRASVQAKARVRSTRVAESATTGTVGAIADVYEISEDRRGRVHATIEQGILSDDLEIRGVLMSMLCGRATYVLVASRP